MTQLYVYTTNVCNCACKHCWIIPDRNKLPIGDTCYIEPELLEQTVIEAKALGLTTIKWTGGEPTIHPQFEELLIIQKRHQLNGRMETNGMNITPERARLLKETGTTHISVSLDGSQAETHDRIRGVQGAFERACQGLQHLVAAGFKPQIIMSLLRENMTEMESLMQLAKHLGAGSIKFNVIQPTLRGEELHEKDESLSVAEYIELNNKLDKEIQPVYPLPIYFDIPIAFHSISALLRTDGASVCGIKNILGLLADGHYALCGIGASIPELIMGMAGKDSLAEIWHNHAILLAIRQEIPNALTGICAVCLMKAQCLGSCIAQNYYRSKDLRAPFWFCATAQAEGLFPMTRIISDHVGFRRIN